MRHKKSEGLICSIFFNTDIALKIMGLKRFLNNDDAAWEDIPNYYFDKMGGLEYILQANIKHYCFPKHFHKLILKKNVH